MSGSTFNFGIRPHTNPAAAAQYFNRLARWQLNGREPTPQEAREIAAAKATYVRCCTGMFRARLRVKSNRPAVARMDENIVDRKNFPASRPRERRTPRRRAAVARDDGGELPPARPRGSATCWSRSPESRTS